MQYKRNPYTVDVSKFDHTDEDLAKKILEAGSDTQKLSEAIAGRQVAEVRLAVAYLMFRDAGNAPRMIAVAETSGRRSVLREVAQYILEREGRFISQDVAWAKRTLANGSAKH